VKKRAREWFGSNLEKVQKRRSVLEPRLELGSVLDPDHLMNLSHRDLIWRRWEGTGDLAEIAESYCLRLARLLARGEQQRDGWSRGGGGPDLLEELTAGELV
jgi:hypothetical protein